MMHTEIDTLSDFETDENSNGILFYAISGISALLIVGFVIYFFWPFGEAFLYQISTETEMQMLTAMHVIYPSIALGLFSVKKKLGWSLIVFSSVINATYGIFAYASDFLTTSSPMDIIKDKMIFFFLAHLIIVVLIFKRSLLQNFNLKRKYFLFTTWTSITISVLLFLLLFTTYN